MQIIGIHDGHNSALCYLNNGKISRVLQEERFARIKNFTGFPEGCINYLTKNETSQLSQIDHFVFCGNYVPSYTHSSAEEHIRAYKRNYGPGEAAKDFLKKCGLLKLRASLLEVERSRWLVEQGISRERISFLDHHTCHAASAYYGWGKFDEPILILTNDGAGDGLCATVSIGDKAQIKRIAQVRMEHSIGILWATLTAMLGMVPLEHEYKLMGMAPYAKPQRAREIANFFLDHFAFTDQGLTWERKGGLPPITHCYEYLRKHLEFVRFDTLCAGLQLFTEEFLVSWVKSAIQVTGISKVAISGGVFMNVKLNKCILEMDSVNDLFIFPSCGDESNVLGASYLQYFNLSQKTAEPTGSVMLGPSYEDIECIQQIELWQKKYPGRLRVERPPSIVKTVAKLLHEGVVIGWFQGAEEFGARALGGRSLLANPSNLQTVKHINELIKSRDFWMPFALSLLDSEENSLIRNPKHIPAPYMILAFDTITTTGIIAGTHPFDKSCRAQVVTREHNSLYYELLQEFKHLTGLGALLNTSLNIHGEPLVSSPADGLDLLLRSKLSVLAMGSYLIRKLD